MRILVMLLLPIGDTLFATPAVHALRVRYPGARITALVYPTNKGILDNNPDIDDFLLWPTQATWPGLVAVVGLFSKLRRARFDLAIEFTNYVWWVTWLSGIQRRSALKLPKMWWLLPSAGVRWRRRHAVEHFSGPVRRLGIPVEDMRLRIEPSAADRARVMGWLDEYGVKPGDLLVGMHAGGAAGWGRKRWEAAGFSQVAGELSGRFGAWIMLMGGKSDAPTSAEIARRSNARIINVTGQTTLGEAAALAARCSLFIGNDSSLLHIAAASGTCVVGLYGLSDPRSYRPWVPGGREWINYAVVRSSLPCSCCFTFPGGITLAAWLRCLLCPGMKAITPERVLEAAERLLQNRQLC
ncbi:MAG: glycosyltransferase family 9 protein [Chloroflexota bacterium]|nr:glycosyltransferase family 9 protein [Chloroflexota bacterium]